MGAPVGDTTKSGSQMPLPIETEALFNVFYCNSMISPKF